MNGELRPRRRRGRVLVVPGDAHGRERARLVLPEDLLGLAAVGADEGPVPGQGSFSATPAKTMNLMPRELALTLTLTLPVVVSKRQICL